MDKKQKTEFVDWMKGEVETSPAMVIADYRGLTVAQMTDLRARCREKGVKFKVAKNTLMRIVIKGSNFEAIEPLLEGPTAIAWHPEDPGAPARVLVDFAKQKGHEALEIKGAGVSGRMLSPAEVKDVLATMPTREELLGTMAGMLINGPQKLAGVLAAGPNKLGRVLGALKDKKEQAEAA